MNWLTSKVVKLHLKKYPRDKEIFRSFAIFLFVVVPFFVVMACNESVSKQFTPGVDLISLHYDHAPDKDDGHSAAADRTILQTMFGIQWIKKHVVAVSGAYGINADKFNLLSNHVMDAAWNDCGGWLDAHTNSDGVVKLLAGRWVEVIRAGGKIWVKEGGQSDFTAAVVSMINQKFPEIDTTQKIIVVQHSVWNEDHTTEAALIYTKARTHYIKIRDANAYLNKKGGDDAFVKAATQHPVFGKIWKAAFDYYNPYERLDFSDTGELMHILGLGEMGFDDFRKRYLSLP